MMASKVQRGPRWLSLIASIFGASNGVAPCRFDSSSRSFSSTNKNSACGSIKRLISQGQATRSTFTSLRVIYFIETSRPPGICVHDDEAVLVILRRILRYQTGKALARGIDDIQVAVRAVIPAQSNIGAGGLIIGSVHLNQGRECQKTGERIVGLEIAEHDGEVPCAAREDRRPSGIGRCAEPKAVPLLGEIE